MDSSDAALIFGSSGGVVALLVFLCIKFKKEIHTRCKSSCCETTLDIENGEEVLK
jgi:hypothetical protein